MKRERGRLCLILSMLLIIVLSSVNVNAAGPLDGQVIDGTLLTSESSVSDEQPLVPENPFDEGASTYGTYLSSGAVNLSDEGSGTIYMSGETYCNRTSDSVQVNLYLDRLINGSWSTYKTAYHTEYDTYYAHRGLYMAVPKGYYYRLRGGHVATTGSKTESTTTCTRSIYID